MAVAALLDAEVEIPVEVDGAWRLAPGAVHALDARGLGLHAGTHSDKDKYAELAHRRRRAQIAARRALDDDGPAKAGPHD